LIMYLAYDYFHSLEIQYVVFGVGYSLITITSDRCSHDVEYSSGD
jgi:hypothetical protein